MGILLTLWPERLNITFAKIRRNLLSERVRRNLRTPHRLHIYPPCRIIGYEHIYLRGGLNVLPDCRIEVIKSGAYPTPILEIGENVSMNYRVHIGVINKVIIGNNVLIGSNVLITDHSHGRGDGDERLIPPTKRPLFSKGPVIIEENVWIGENCCILPNVTIGKGSIVGANSVVTHDCPPYSVICGNPAKIVKMLS